MTRACDDGGAALVAAGAALLGLAVLADSGLEHYRGSFHNKAMVLPLVAAGLSVGATVLARRGESRAVDALGEAAHDIAIATGAAGFAFHAYNIGKRPGGWSWVNLFHAAPIGAPFALTLAGLLGRMARRRGRGEDGRALAAVASAGIAGSAAEAALRHLRGAYQNPAMVLPVTIPPVAATLLGAAACAPRARVVRGARAWLKATAVLGLVGSALHAYGISRRMGGWANWSQNLLAGPPLPAPPSFTGLALAGLAALGRLERARDARAAR